MNSKKIATVLRFLSLVLGLSLFSVPAQAMPFFSDPVVESHRPATPSERYRHDQIQKEEGDADTLLVPGTNGDGASFEADDDSDWLKKLLIKLWCLFWIGVVAVGSLVNSVATPGLITGWMFKKSEMTVEGPFYMFAGVILAGLSIVALSPILFLGTFPLVMLPGLVLLIMGLMKLTEPPWKLAMTVITAMILAFIVAPIQALIIILY